MTARLLDGVDITDAVYTDCSITEPDPAAVMPDGTVGEVAWVTGTTYTAGVYVIDTVSHMVYQDGAGGVSNKAPRLDPVRWGTGVRPTNKWALADKYKSTRTVGASPLTVTLRPGAVSDVVLFGLDGLSAARLEQWDAPGGNKVRDIEISGVGWAGDLWVSYYFDMPFTKDRMDFRELFLSSACELVLTLTGEADVALGILAVGRYESLGLTVQGASASPVDYSRITVNDFGDTTIVRGRVATDLRADVICDRSAAARAKRVIDRMAGKPCVLSLSDLPHDEYLSTFGLVSAEVVSEGSNHSKLSINSRGLV
jgi:hypothetical protein